MVTNRAIIRSKLLEKFCGGTPFYLNGKSDVAFSTDTLLQKIGGEWQGDDLIVKSELILNGETYLKFYEEDGDVFAETTDKIILL